jgi:hypothetical protein
METIVIVLGMLSAFLLGSWVTYRAGQNKSPIEIPKNEDMADIISPYEQEQKQKIQRVKV